MVDDDVSAAPPQMVDDDASAAPPHVVRHVLSSADSDSDDDACVRARERHASDGRLSFRRRRCKGEADGAREAGSGPSQHTRSFGSRRGLRLLRLEESMAAASCGGHDSAEETEDASPPAEWAVNQHGPGARLTEVGSGPSQHRRSFGSRRAARPLWFQDSKQKLANLGACGDDSDEETEDVSPRAEQGQRPRARLAGAEVDAPREVGLGPALHRRSHGRSYRRCRASGTSAPEVGEPGACPPEHRRSFRSGAGGHDKDGSREVSGSSESRSHRHSFRRCRASGTSAPAAEAMREGEPGACLPKHRWPFRSGAGDEGGSRTGSGLPENRGALYAKTTSASSPRGLNSSQQAGGAKVPYRRRVRLTQSPQINCAPVVRRLDSRERLSANEATEAAEATASTGRVLRDAVRPTNEGVQTVLFHELPPILITDVRYVNSDSEVGAASSNRQDQFEYLSSEEGGDSEEDEMEHHELRRVLELPSTRPADKDKALLVDTDKMESLVSKACREKEDATWVQVHSLASEDNKLTNDESGEGDFNPDDMICLEDRRLEERYAFNPTGAGFREKFLAMRRQEFAEGFWPEYYEDVNLADVEARAQAALAVLVKKCKCGTGALHEHVCCGLGRRFVLDRFLANYFMDPEVFDVDQDLRALMMRGEFANRCFPSYRILHLMKCIPMICKSCLLAAVHVSADCELPDKPLRYLANALQHASLTCPDARTIERDEVIGSVQSLQKRRLEHGNLVRAAVMRLATATKEREMAGGLHESDAVRELEGLLVAEGLPQREGGQDDSLLWIAASYNSVTAVSLLYSFGANVNEAQDKGDQQTQTALERSAFLGHTNVASFLVAKGAFFGKAMLLAAKEGHADIVRILLGHDAHPLVRCRRTGHSPLSLAVIGSHWGVAELLVGAGARVDMPLNSTLTRMLGLEDEMTLLDYADDEGKGRMLRNLVARCACSNLKTSLEA